MFIIMQKEVGRKKVEEKNSKKIKKAKKQKKDMQSITLGLCCSGVNTMYAMGHEVNLTGCYL